MGALSNEGPDDWDGEQFDFTPQFIYEAFMDRYCHRGVRNGPEHLAPNELIFQSHALVRQLNEMSDRQAAYDLAKAHPWYVVNEYNQCAIWRVTE